jgi:hypothetical protein
VKTFLASAIDLRENLFPFLAGLGCLCGIYVFSKGIFLLRRKRRSQRGPAVTPIRDAKAGLLEVRGIAEGKPTLSAAISGKPCFYYRAVVWRQDSAQGHSWSKVAEETMCRTFLLSDQTGSLLVDPRGAVVDLPRDSYEEYGKRLLSTHTDIPAGLEAFLVRHKVDTRAALRVEEYLVSPAASLFVCGTAAKNVTLDATGTPLSPVKKKPASAKSLAPTAKGAAAAATPRVVPVIAQTHVIRLSPEPRATPAAEMTMQSRLAAALARARMTNLGNESNVPLDAPATSVVVARPISEQSISEQSVSEQPVSEQPISEQPIEEQPIEEQRVEERVEERVEKREKPIESPPPPLPPPLLIRQAKGTSTFTVSLRGRDVASTSPGGMAIALVASGPLLTLAGAYYLLLQYGRP